MIFKLCNRTIQYSFYLLFFLVPLFMTPFNYELFEFNKMMLVYALTAVIAAAWLSKMIVAKKVLFKRTPLDLPIFIFLISQFLSFIFSIDHHTSLLGYYGRFHGGLLSTISYITLYYAFVSNIHYPLSIIYYLKVILASGFLVASYGIFEHFGVDDQYWVQDVRNRVFSTLGQPNWLAAYLSVLLPISMVFALVKKKVWNLYCLLPVVFYICLLYTKSRSGFLGFGVTFLLFTLYQNKVRYRVTMNRSLIWFMVTFCFLLITFFVGTPFEGINRYGTFKGLMGIIREDKGSVREEKEVIFAPELGGTESGEIRKIVWQGAIDIWRHYPIFGSGPETFAYSYYQHRPKEHNLTSEWDFLYNKAHNEYLNFLATTGMVGLAGYLSFIGGFIYWCVKRILGYYDTRILSKNSSNNSPNILISQYLSIALFSGWLSILVTNFFGFSVVPVALFFFLIPAMSFALVTQGINKNLASREPCFSQARNSIPPLRWKKKLNVTQKFSIFLVLLVSCYMLLVIGKLWLADVAYAKGRNLNQSAQHDLALTKLQVAIRLNPGEPVYKEEITTSLAHLAFLAQQQEVKILSRQLVQQAIKFSNQAIEISPYNLNFWKGRAKMFYTLSQVDEKHFENSLMALTTAHMLAPTDAKVAYNLGLVLSQVGQNEEAIKVLEETVDLKPDYRNAHYALALFYKEASMNEEAVGELEYILDNIATDDREAKKKLEEWRKK